MDADHLESLKRFHGLDGWDRARAGGFGLFVWNLAFDGDEFPGWTLASEQYVLLPNGNRIASTVWQPVQGGGRGPIRLDVVCHPSAEAAFDAFVLRLSDVQLQEMVRQSVDDIGELLFVSAEGGLALNLHGNVVAEAAAMGAATVPALEFIREFDRWLLDEADLGEPIPDELAASAGDSLRLLDDAGSLDEEVGAETLVAAAASAPQEPSAALPPTAAFQAGGAAADFPQPDFALMKPPSERPPVVKVFFDEGDVLAAEGGLNYVPAREGGRPLRMVRVGPAARRRKGGGRTADARPKGETR